MKPVDFEGSNITFTKPQGWTDEQCGSLRAYTGKDEATGSPLIRVAFKPEPEELAALNAGQSVMLDILSSGMPPIAVYVHPTEERGEQMVG